MARWEPLAVLAFATWPTACSLAREEIESQVLVSLEERIRASGEMIAVDSIRLDPRDGAAYPGRVYLRSGDRLESDSLRVKADLAGLEYDFPSPGPVLSRIFR
jgi:hypothetical protein